MQAFALVCNNNGAIIRRYKNEDSLHIMHFLHFILMHISQLFIYDVFASTSNGAFV